MPKSACHFGTKKFILGLQKGTYKYPVKIYKIIYIGIMI